MLDSRFYHYAVVATNFLLLNLVWLLMCLPVITIVPATAALFGVVKSWQDDQDRDVLGPFLRQFKHNFVQSSVLGTLWLFLGATIIANFILIGQLTTPLQAVVLTVNTFAGLAYVFTTIFLFPVLVTYNLGWLQVLKYAFVLSIARFLVTLQCLLVVASLALATYLLPLLLPVSGSVAAYVVYRLCQGVFLKIERAKQD